MENLIRLLFIAILISSCKEKIDFETPKELGDLVYTNRFENANATNFKFDIKKAIHNESICFNSKDSTISIFNQNLKLINSATISLWIKPEFYGVNGTIITLSNRKKDYPINSVLSIYMNKNRIAVMQQGNDLRKTDYDNHKAFTVNFIALEELNIGELYYLTYTFEDNKVSVFIDNKLYSEYKNIPNLESTKFITLGASWNRKGTKYHFRGCMDDLYIYNNELEYLKVNQLMEYNHIYYKIEE
jgi:hypothetical protein